MTMLSHVCQSSRKESQGWPLNDSASSPRSVDRRSRRCCFSAGARNVDSAGKRGRMKKVHRAMQMLKMPSRMKIQRQELIPAVPSMKLIA